MQLLVILTPVIFGFMGFAFDLGRLYLIRGELNQAATAMALSAATQLIGTQDALDKAGVAASLPLDDSTGHAARYNFGTVAVGESTGLLSSTFETGYYTTLAAAAGEGSDQADGTTARHVQVNLMADAPLVFWSLLSMGQARTTPIAARAVAGLSAPMCTACGVEPFAVQAIDSGDETNFGLTPAARYTFAYRCNPTPPGNQSPQPLGPGQQVIYYLLLDPMAKLGGSYIDSGDLGEEQALYRIGAQGLLPYAAQAKSCMQIGALETQWAGAGVGNCNAPPPRPVQFMLCGLYARFNQELPEVCATIPEVETLAMAYLPDSDLAEADDYTAYTGNTRRVITLPIVGPDMTVLGFRQFLLQPNPGTEITNPADQDGRFSALYMGMNPADGLTTPAPLRQGRLDGCQNGYSAAAGPGKVVLHQ